MREENMKTNDSVNPVGGEDVESTNSAGSPTRVQRIVSIFYTLRHGAVCTFDIKQMNALIERGWRMYSFVDIHGSDSEYIYRNHWLFYLENDSFLGRFLPKKTYKFIGKSPCLTGFRPMHCNGKKSPTIWDSAVKIVLMSNCDKVKFGVFGKIGHWLRGVVHA